MPGWDNFFQGELGAAAALAGLLFVSVSVNQARILELGRMADRGLEALAMLFLVLTVASLALVPRQPPRVLGAEIATLALALLAGLVPLQRGYLRHLDQVHRSRSTHLVRFNQLAIALVALGGLLLAWRSDMAGPYAVAAGILLIFIGAGANAWVLLIEINR
jgi:modulator of FtsH protease